MSERQHGIMFVLRWLALISVLIALFVLLSGQVPGSAPTLAFMDRFGFEAARYRLSLLSVSRLVVTVAALFVAVRIVNGLVHRYVRRVDGLDPTQKLLTEKLVGIGVIAVAFFMGIDALGIDLTALTVFSGAFGLAVGFGLQKTFGNLFAGLILLMDRSIKPGDVIVVGDRFGWVNRIGTRAVSVVTRDGKEHLIPNENLMTQEVENWSYSDRNVRLHIPVRVSYDSDQDRARELMLEAVRAAPRVLDDPATVVWIVNFGDSGIEYDIRMWISDPENGVGNVTSDVLTRIWKLFCENDIRIPFPQRDLHIRDWPTENSA
ncbi:mechanosensitive ion channel domain-containing protein [Sphingomonas sp. LaA6.9]|uniref:mechanosensitive ion channel family protein n=1 Tax=Sphingomonas sp. LaA6.9 TaxID=2919914 RepID=UPI0032AFDE56